MIDRPMTSPTSPRPTRTEREHVMPTTLHTYRTVEDVMALEVIPTLGGFEADYDLDAVAAEMVAYEPKRGVYFVREDVDFWAIAAAHEITA